MDIDVLFNRPDHTLPIDDLVQEVHAAQERVVLASAWFTHVGIAQAIIDCRARTKIVILSRGDLKRGDYQAYKRIENSAYIMSRQHGSGLYVLGGSSWESGIMHHKFCLIDYRVVWTGSYNYTIHASRNYETLLRIDSLRVNEEFWAEAMNIIGEEPYTYAGDDSPDMAFCVNCNTRVNRHEVCAWNSDGDVWCDDCISPEEETTTCEQCHSVEASDACCYEHGGGPICVRCCAQLHEHSEGETGRDA